MASNNIGNPVSCIICRKRCDTRASLSKHYKKKHVSSATRNTDTNREHRLANVASIDANLKSYRDKEEIKLALREQLAPSPLDNLPAYNVEAYRIAIRTMPQMEAYKLAKNPDRAQKFIDEFNQSLTRTTDELVYRETKSTSHPQEKAEELYDHYKPTKIGEEMIRRSKEERAQRERLREWSIQQDVKEEASFSERMVKTRTNQAEFAKRVASNFSFKCCVTGSSEPVEAAHIEPISIGNNNNTSNGLLLIVCLHRLLDSGKMAINPEEFTVHFSKDCTWFGVPMFENKLISTPHTALNTEGLTKLWEKFIENQKLLN